MKRYLLFVAKCLSLMGVVYGCIQPFTPPEITSADSYLVVDGFLNFGEDTTKITLSRTQNTLAKTAVVTEKGAKITIQGEKGEVYPLLEKGNGVYYLPSRITNQSIKYRLLIVTRNGSSYESDYNQVSKTPEIDSIGYKVDDQIGAMLFYVNTRDASNSTRFYRWKFEETWEYRTPLYSFLEVVGTGTNKKVVERAVNINTCYRTLNSSNILLGSSVKLSQDIIKDLPIHQVYIASNKLLVRYSILVRQYGLTREAFEYWTSLSKSTQGTGTLFDPLPSQVTGNIRNTRDSKELVFGFFSAVTEQKKRIFLSPGLGVYPECDTDTIPVACPPRRETDCALETAGLLLSYADPFQQTVTVSSGTCVDCRYQGGVLKRPSFW